VNEFTRPRPAVKRIADSTVRRLSLPEVSRGFEGRGLSTISSDELAQSRRYHLRPGSKGPSFFDPSANEAGLLGPDSLAGYVNPRTRPQCRKDPSSLADDRRLVHRGSPEWNPRWPTYDQPIESHAPDLPRANHCLRPSRGFHVAASELGDRVAQPLCRRIRKRQVFRTWAEVVPPRRASHRWRWSRDPDPRILEKTSGKAEGGEL